MFCKHPRDRLTVKSEGDRCSWVECTRCGARGPKKHSVQEAKRRFKAMGFKQRPVAA